MIVERAVAAVAVELDPPPAALRIPAGEDGDVADARRAQDLVPLRRLRKVAPGLTHKTSDRPLPARKEMFRRKGVRGVLELQRARHMRAVVVLGQPAAGDEGLRIGERPTPAIEPD